MADFDFTSVLKTLGAGALSSLGPMGSAALTLINAALPEGSKLTTTSTGTDALNKLGSIPESDQVKIAQLLYEFKNNELALTTQLETDRLATQRETSKGSNELEMLRIMEETDRQSEFRPKLAVLFGRIAAFFSGVMGAALAYQWAVHGKEPSVEILFVVMYLPMHVTLNYFKIRSDDKQLLTSFLSQGKIAPRMKMTEAIGSLLTKRQQP